MRWDIFLLESRRKREFFVVELIISKAPTGAVSN